MDFEHSVKFIGTTLVPQDRAVSVHESVSYVGWTNIGKDNTEGVL